MLCKLLVVHYCHPDFVFGDDVAQASIDVVKKEVRDIINFGCGEAVTIKETIEY